MKQSIFFPISLLLLSLALFAAPMSAAFGATTITWQQLRQLNLETGKAPGSLRALSGKEVRLPGYMVPLEGDEKRIVEFLLVPTLGACIHVPPPPPNQIVFVFMRNGAKAVDAYYPVWVTGTLRIADTKTDLAQASYFMDGMRVELFQGF